jgi:hypothetical protein
VRCSRIDAVIRSGGGLAVKVVTLGGSFAQTPALKGEPVRIVHEAVDDGVCDGRIANAVVPVLDGQSGWR